MLICTRFGTCEMQIETDLKYCFFDAGTVSNPWSGSVCKFRSLGFYEYRNNQGCGKCFPFFFFQRCQPPKSGDSLFCTTALTPPPPWMSTALQNPPARKLTQLQWLRTLYGVLHEVQAIKICFHLCQWLNTCKNVPETVQWIKKFEFWEKKWAK